MSLWGIMRVCPELEQQVWEDYNCTFIELLKSIGFDSLILLDKGEIVNTYAFSHKDCDYRAYTDIIFKNKDDGTVELVSIY